MLKHVKFGPVVQIGLIVIGTGAGALGGMLKAGTTEDTINKFIDVVNNTFQAANEINKMKK